MDIDPLIGITIDDKYEILSVIGAGGMGSMYKAHNKALDRPVAVKIMHHDVFLDSSNLKRFQAEAASLKALNHAHVVHVHHFGLVQPSMRPYLVLEYLDGGSLSERIKQRPLTIEECWTVFAQVSAGLAHAHSNSILHRDIKPSNIMFLLPEEWHLKIVDFGVAKVLETESVQKLTQTGALIGTPAYMSPEYLSGHKAGTAADVYSVGCLMYECLFGKPLFEGDNFVEMAMRQISDEPNFPERSKSGEAIPAALQALLARTLEKSPNKRIANGQELHAWIEKLRTQPHMVPDDLKRTAGRPRIVALKGAPGKKLWIPLAAVTLGVLFIVFSMARINQSIDDRFRAAARSARTHASETLFSPAWEEISGALNDSKSGSIHPELAEAIAFSADRAIDKRTHYLGDATCNLITEAARLPTNEQISKDDKLRFVCWALNENAALYSRDGGNDRLRRADEFAGELKQLSAKTVPAQIELRGALQGLIALAEAHKALVAELKDAKSQQAEIDKSLELCRQAMELHKRFSPSFDAAQTLPRTLRLYLATLSESGRLDELRQVLDVLTSDTRWKDKLAEMPHRVPFWSGMFYIQKGMKIDQAEKNFLEAINFAKGRAPEELPMMYFYAAYSQYLQNKGDEARMSILQGQHEAVRSKQPNTVQFDCALLAGNIMRVCKRFPEAHAQAQRAERLLPKSTFLPVVAKQKRAELSQLEERIEARDYTNL